MSTTHQDKSGGKPRQRGRKADQRNQKPEQQQSPKLDRRDDDQIGATVASTEAFTNSEAASEDVPLVGEVLPPDATSIGATALADYGPITIQTIARAYGDYTTRSFEESRSLVEKLMGVRSFDKAIEVQTEFARQAYANFVAESERICALYGELARQIFKPWESFAAKVTPARRQIS
jgi:Phasin protein